MKKIFLALFVLTVSASINFSGIITNATAAMATLSRGGSIVKEIASTHLGFFGCGIQVAAEDDKKGNGGIGNGKEKEAGENPPEGGIERIWNAVFLG